MAGSGSGRARARLDVANGDARPFLDSSSQKEPASKRARFDRSDGGSATIMPHQQLHPRPWDPASKPRITVFEEAQWTDCTAFADFDALLSATLQCSQAGGSSHHAVPTPIKTEDGLGSSGDREAALSDKAKGKRPIAGEGVHLEVVESKQQAILACTSCLFQISPLSDDDHGKVLRVVDAVDSSPGKRIELGPARLLSKPSQGEAGSLILSHLELNRAGRHLFDVPICDTLRIAEDRLPQHLTNSQWLLAAVTLAERHVVELDVSVVLVSQFSNDEGPLIPEATHQAILVELNITVALREAAFVPRNRPEEADLLVTLMRFCIPTSVEWERLCRDKVTASTVYANLPSANVAFPDCLQPDKLDPTLLPFQRRSVHFLLRREGKRLTGTDGHDKLENEDQLHGKPVVGSHEASDHGGLWWTPVGNGLFFNPLRGCFTRDATEAGENVCGGILAEEMGLGKTVEVLALILLNPAAPERNFLPSYRDEEQEIDVWPCKATLIVCPEVLRQQWLDEAMAHAPHLRLFSYLGHARAKKSIPPGQDWQTFAREFDVIVTTFETLQKEVNVARKEKPRSRRFERKYERPRSPLILLEYHRVVMDEVQLEGNGSPAETCSMISRASSIAVSGTPIKRIEDLGPCLRFLRVPDYAYLRGGVDRLLKPPMAPYLIRALKKLSTRHTKVQVRGEMVLPPQTRWLVPIQFASVEKAFYDDLFANACAALQLDTNGAPIGAAWQLNVPLMRAQLLLLRQACTHPQVAGRALGGQMASGALRSIDEVLAVMIDNVMQEEASLSHSLAVKRIDDAVLRMQTRRSAKDGGSGALDLAEAMLQDVIWDLQECVAKVNKLIATAHREGPLYRFTDDELRKSVDMPDGDPSGDPDLDSAALASLEQRRKARVVHTTALKQRRRFFLESMHRAQQFLGNVYFQRGEDLTGGARAAAAALTVEAKDEAMRDDDDDAEDEAGSTRKRSTALRVAEGDKHLSPAPNAFTADVDGMPAPGATAAARDEASPATKDDAISQVIAMEDIAPASDATTAPQAGALDPETERALDRLRSKEDESYARAEKLRQELLAEFAADVELAAKVVQEKGSKVDEDQGGDLHQTIFETGGLLSYGLVEQLNELSQLLREHNDVLMSWRKQLYAHLLRPINRDVDKEKEGDDIYAENLDAQGLAEALIEMYRPLLAQREVMLTGREALGATSRPQLMAELERATRQARQAELHGYQYDAELGLEFDPDVVAVQKQQLRHLKQLEKERQRVNLSGRAGLPSLPDIIRELREATERTERREELHILRGRIAQARDFGKEQQRYLDELRKETGRLVDLFNARSTYFKAIQALSDQVRDLNTKDAKADMERLGVERAHLAPRLARAQGRLRYLHNLVSVETGDFGGDCWCCTEPLKKGILTQTCGHVSCEDCFSTWLKQGRRVCALCKTPLERDANGPYKLRVHRVTTKETAQEAERARRQAAATQASAGVPQPVAPVQHRFHQLDVGTLPGIGDIPTGPIKQGSKLTALTQHLLYTAARKPGVKSLVFSSFSRALDLVSFALKANGLRHVRVDTAGISAGRAVDTFRNDPSTNILLLHSQAQSAGLNLICATQIFLMEPLVNHSIELQALGRVHRIGQTAETCVFCYSIQDSVEERIALLAASRGQSLYVHERSRSTETADSAALAASRIENGADAPGSIATGTELRKGEYVENVDDLLACFFSIHSSRA